MPTVTFLEKAYGAFPPEALEPKLISLCKDLRVQIRVKDRTAHGWIQAEVTGEDETVGLRLLDREFGLAPAHLNNIERFSSLAGRIVDSVKNEAELHVDVGVFEPQVTYAAVSLPRVQAQLGDGKDLPLRDFVELYCLHKHMPLHVKIVDVTESNMREALRAELSEQQLGWFTQWLLASLDRLIVFGALRQDVEHAISASKHFRDVIGIESLGWLEHAIICKLGTDAVGLIPPMGRFLSRAAFAPFSPRKILRVISRSAL